MASATAVAPPRVIRSILDHLEKRDCCNRAPPPPAWAGRCKIDRPGRKSYNESNPISPKGIDGLAGSKRCPKCGLVQLARPQCKKCGAPLSTTDGGRRAVTPASSLPPPQSASNPYAPPEAELRAPVVMGGSGGVWRDGPLLVAVKNATLPDRCVKCNRPTPLKIERTYYWHPPVWYLLILLNWLIYAIVAAAVRKKAVLEVGLCEDHRRRRKMSMWIGTLIPLLGIGGCMFGGSSQGLIVIGIGLTVLGLIWLVVASQLLSANRIDENIILLKGVSSEYLSVLQPYPNT